MAESHKYFAFRSDTPPHILKVDEGCTAFNVKIPVDVNWNKAREKILIVAEYVDSQDIKSKRLGSSHYGTAITAVFNLAEDYIRPFSEVQRYATAIANYNFFRTFHIQNADLHATCEAACADRIRALVRKLKPTKIVVFGDNAARALYSKWDIIARRGWEFEIEGVPAWSTIDLSRGYAGAKDSDDDDVSDKTINFANLLGYASRCVANALLGRNPYSIGEIKPNPIYVDSIGKFKSMMDKLNDSKVIALDSETESLARITNRILTLQFSTSSKAGYVLPLFHIDCPFQPKETQYIKRRMREFFALDFDPLDTPERFLIGHNLKFDFTVIRQTFDIHSIYWPAWDTMAGEYCFHPDTLVCTENGKIPIKNIVTESKSTKVWSFNHEKQCAELKPVLLASEHQTNEMMYEIEYEGGSLRLTGNHKIWSVTRNKYVRVDEIYPDEDVLVLDESDPLIL